MPSERTKRIVKKKILKLDGKYEELRKMEEEEKQMEEEVRESKRVFPDIEIE